MADVIANDLRFNVVRIGQGEQTVVFLHGLVFDNLSSFYYTLANTVAQHADVILYDLRGHGRSDRPATGYTIEQAVEDLIAVLDALDVQHPVYLVGNSYGGTVGLGAAISHPDRVAGLGLIEAHFAVEGWGEHMAGSLALAAYGLDDDELQTWLVEQGGRKLNRMARNAESLIYDTTMLADLEAVKPLARADLRSIRCPVLAFYGEHSDLMDRARDLDELVPDCTLHIFEDCTHSVLLEATNRLKALLVPFTSDATYEAPEPEPGGVAEDDPAPAD